MCQVKSTLTNIAQFEVGLEFLLVEVVFLCAQFLSIVPPIPGLQFLARQVLVQQFLQFGCLTLSSFERRSPNGLQELIYGLRVLGHAVGQDIVGRVLITEEFCLLDTQRHGTLDDLFVVVGVAVVTTRGIGHEQLLP